jgi:uncharacterized repeat protein (TIGR01451 family)
MSAGCRSTYQASARTSGEAIRSATVVRVLMALFALLGVALLTSGPARAAGTSGGSQWVTDVSGPYWSQGTLTFGSTPITGAISAVTGTTITAGMGGSAYCNQQEATNVALTGNAGGQITGAGQYYTPSTTPSDAVGVCQGNPGSAFGAATTRTVTFNKPLIAPVFIVNNLDASDLTFNPGPGGGPIQLQTLSKSPPMQVVGGNTLTDPLKGGSTGCHPTFVGQIDNSGCGAFRMTESGGAVRSFTMLNSGGAGSDGWLWSLWFPSAPLTKQFSPSRIPVGGTSQLTFSIDNAASAGQPDPLTPLDFADALPAGLTLADGSVSSSGCGSPSVTDAGGGGLGAGDAGVRATNISVAAGATCKITVNVTAGSPSGCYLNNNNNISTTIGNVVPTASACLEVYPAADVKIEKSTTAPLVAGQQGSYNLKVTNNGPSPAVNVKVTDKLPGAVSYVSSSTGCNEISKTVTCNLASLAPGTSHTFTVDVKVASSANDCSDVENNATVSNDVVDTDLTNNASKICNFERRSNLKVTKIPSRTTVPPGGQVMYTLVVENLGPSDDDNVKLTDPMAPGLSLVSAKPGQGSCSTAGGKVSCDLGTLAAGGSTQVLVTANVTSTATSSSGTCSRSGRSDSITNTATASGDSFDPDLSNNKGLATVCPGPGPDTTFDLVVTKTAAKKSVYVGQALKYTITVTNKGPASAPNAKLTDTLNSPASVVSVKASQGSCTKSLPMTCQFGTIKAGGKVTITVTVKLRDDGCEQRNVASATGEGTDSNPANNLARVDVCAKPVPLRLTKVADRGSVRAGGTVGYTIRVSNPSPGEARNVKVCDKLPSGLVYVSSKAAAKFSNGQYCWTIETLGAHKSTSFRITVRALSSASGDRVNRATASAKGAKTQHAKDPVRVLAARASGGGVTG